MPSLFNQQISATYKGLLKTTSNGILSSSLAQITDGNGNDSPLSMSITEIQFNTGSNTFKFPTTRGTSGQILKLSDANGTLDWVADASGDVTKTGTIALNTIAVWNDNADQLRSDTTMSINTNHTISLLQPNSVPTDVGSFNIGGGNIANVTGQNNTGFGSQNLNAVLEGSNNTAMGVSSLDSVTSGNSNTGFGSRVLTDLTIGDFNTAIGSSVLNDVSSGENNTAVGYNAGGNVTTGSGNTYIGKSAGFSGTGSNNIYIGEGSGMSITSGDNNVIIGSNAGNYISGTSNNIIISDGSGNNRIQVDSGGNVGIGTSTIESYWSGYTALKVGYNNSIFGNTADSVGSAFFISQNLYNDGGNYRYVGSGSDEGGLIDLRGGAFVFSNAPLGTAGNVASIVPRLTISSGGAATFNSSSQTMLSVVSSGVNVFQKLENSTQSAYFGLNSSGSFVVQTSGSSFSDKLTISSGGLVQVGDGTSQNTFLTTKSVAGWASGIKLTRGLGDGSDLSNNNFGMLVTDNGWEVSTFTSPLDNTTGRSAKLVISSGGGVFIPGFANPTTSYLSFRDSFAPNVSGGVGFMAIDHAAGNSDGLGIYGHDGVTISTAQTPRLNISSGGNVGIGVSALSAERLTVDGMTSGNTTFSMLARNSSLTTSFWIRDNGDGYLRANAWIYGSDLRLKENISDVENGIDMVSKMKPKHFDYIDGSKDNLGFIAQDVQKIIPQAVSITDQEKGTLGLKTDFLVPYLVKAIQEQQTIIEDLKSRIETLEG